MRMPFYFIVIIIILTDFNIFAEIKRKLELEMSWDRVEQWAMILK